MSGLRRDKMGATKLLILCLFGLVVGVLSNPTPGDSTPAASTPGEFNLDQSVSKFAIKLHKAAAQKAGNSNTISSPFAIQLLLSLYATGTEGSLRQELVDSLSLGDFDQIPQRFGSMSRQLSSVDADTLSIVNRLYVPPFKSTNDKNEFPLVEKFYQDSRAYKADVKELDFQDQAKAAEIINQWVAEQTHQHIKTAVSAQDIPAETVLALLNVIYFQGNWAKPFKTSETKDEDFHVTRDQMVKKPMMHINSYFQYSDKPDIGAKVLSLNYKEEPFRMVIVLPNEVDGLSSVLDKLEEKGLQSALAMESYRSNIDLKLPKFNIDTKLDLNDLLPKVGVSKLFTEGAKGLIKNKSVVVSKALQKAFVKVDEEGSTAGAFTGIFAVKLSGRYNPLPPIDFHADRPFFFAICHGDLIIFAGSYVQ